MPTYGIDSIGVVKATQKLSNFLGVPVAAIDVFSASCIQELANFSGNLLLKSQPHHMNNPSYAPEDETESTEFVVDVSKSHQWSIYALQPLALVFISILLVSPAYLSITTFQSLIASVDKSALEALARVTVVSVVVTKPRQFYLRVQAQHHVEGNIERLSKFLGPPIQTHSLDYQFSVDISITLLGLFAAVMLCTPCMFDDCGCYWFRHDVAVMEFLWDWNWDLFLLDNCFGLMNWFRMDNENGYGFWI
ncbi:hypothetical protein KIW84_070312 [Lathyrus oleraceus]|uniref:Carrier domain-containing protein n=1 Tax=Pisum sativum TaxID=3888 RepID=A0A9D4ZRQ1_PEA|nr:hypothetical protein KIW84_070312 [Pisum sativum]